LLRRALHVRDGRIRHRVTGSPNADRYLEISFTGSSTIAAGEISSFLQITVDRVSTFNENNDYSHDATKMWPTFSEWTHVTMYRLGTQVWGTEP